MFRRHLYQKSQKEYYKTCRYLADYYAQLLNKIQAKKAGKERKRYYPSEQLELILALAYQLFSLPDEVNHSKAIDQLLSVYHNSTQKEALIRLLRGFLQTSNNILVSQGAQEAAEMLLLYIEADLKSLGFLQSASYLLAKAKSGQLFSKEKIYLVFISGVLDLIERVKSIKKLFLTLRKPSNLILKAPVHIIIEVLPTEV